MGATYIKGRVAEIKEKENGDLILRYEDIENGGQIVEAEYDLVVLAVGVQPNRDVERLFPDEELGLDDWHFVAEPNDDLRPRADDTPRRLRRRRCLGGEGHRRLDPPRRRRRRAGCGPPGGGAMSEQQAAHRRLRLPLRRQHLRPRRRGEGEGGAPGRGRRRPLRDVALRVLRRHAAGHDPRDRGAGPRRPRRRVLLAEAPPVHVPRRRHARRHEPVPVHAGEHPRAGLVGAHRRPRGRDGEGDRPRPRRRREDAAHRPARPARRRDDAEDDGRRRRHRRAARGDRPRRHRSRRLPRRARARARRLGGRRSARCTRTAATAASSSPS